MWTRVPQGGSVPKQIVNGRMKLLNRLSDKSALTGVIGLGYVSLPFVLRYAEVGHREFNCTLLVTDMTGLTTV